MDRCPICRAALNGAEVCRRCRAELGTAQRAEREAQALVGAAVHRLCLGDAGSAERLLRRAATLHAAPDIPVLLRFAATLPRARGATEAETSPASRSS